MPSVFVDTNVILYLRDASAPAKNQACVAWLSRLSASKMVTINRQVINEAYANLIYKSPFKLQPTDARQFVGSLEDFAMAPTGPLVLAEAWGIQDQYGLHFWDALLIASANAAACDYFLSEDLSDGQLYDRVRAINPFRHSPEDVLGRAP
jgi:predicted nucleic acid-binding protein